MAYRVEILATARTSLRALPRDTRRRLGAAIDELADNPRRQGSEMLRGKPRRHRYRVGDYRLVYEIDDHEQLVLVVKVGDRKEIYR